MENRFNKRQSNFELLRIIAMLLIVMHHAAMYNGTSFSGFGSKFNRILMLGGKLGVDIFVLISAYFMVDKNFKFSRIINLIIQTTFYSLLIYVLFCCLGLEKFTFKDFLQSSVFACFTRYGFITNYLLLLLISPLLNIVIKNLTQKQYGIICSFIFGVVLFPYIWHCLFNEYMNFPSISYFSFFICLYFIAGYIKKYGVGLSNKQVIWLLCLFIIFQVSTVFSTIREVDTIFALGNTMISILLLLVFKNFNFQSKFINRVSSHTLGVYLIHEHYCIRAFWWKYFFGLIPFSSKWGYFGMVILAVVVTFIICEIIDLLREVTVHKLYVSICNKIDKKRQEKVEQSGLQ